MTFSVVDSILHLVEEFVVFLLLKLPVLTHSRCGVGIFFHMCDVYGPPYSARPQLGFDPNLCQAKAKRENPSRWTVVPLLPLNCSRS